jgi:23S rRNA maturation-related 3'-5' exoribonuclease YhaM
MTKYKPYLFDNGTGKAFPKPDVSSISITNTELFESEEKRLSKKVVPLTKKNNSKFSKLIAGFNSAEIKNDGQYLDLSFVTPEGPLKGKIWGNGNDLKEVIYDLVPSNIYILDGKWNEYPAGSGNFSVVIDRYLPLGKDGESVVSFVDENRAVLQQELNYYISKMSEPYQNLAFKLVDTIWDDFSVAPAAKGFHHCHAGGLLQHTVEVLRCAYNLIHLSYEQVEEKIRYIKKINDEIVWRELQEHRQNPNAKKFFSPFFEKEEHFLTTSNELLTHWKTKPANYDVVMFSILVHDLGKVMEYSYYNQTESRYNHFFPGFMFSKTSKTLGPGMDENGLRLGHITLSIIFVNHFLIQQQFTDGDFLLDVLSCISTHHGKKEWGSPTVPQNANEFLVHFSDYVDSRFSQEK